MKRILEKNRKLPDVIKKFRNEMYEFNEPNSCIDAAIEILTVIMDVMPFYMNDVYPTMHDCIVSDIDLEEPYCTISKETFSLLQFALVKAYDEGFEDEQTFLLMKRLLQLLQSTFQRHKFQT